MQTIADQVNVDIMTISPSESMCSQRIDKLASKEWVDKFTSQDFADPCQAKETPEFPKKTRTSQVPGGGFNLKADLSKMRSSINNHKPNDSMASQIFSNLHLDKAYDDCLILESPSLVSDTS